MALGKPNRRKDPLELKHMVERWLSLGTRKEQGFPHDVPRGHFVVYVGQNMTRFVIPIAWLARTEFQDLLRKAEEEYGFSHVTGITIPCKESGFRSLVEFYT